MDALRFSGVDVGYTSPILQGVDLTVAPGEVVGLVGPNGAGKTTLLRAVTGAARVFAGGVEIEGRPVGSFDARSLARVVSVLPQASPVAFAFTVRAYVTMGRHPHLSRLQEPGVADAAAVERAMELTDTQRLADVAVDTLSGGDLQRVVLAQALAQEPRILLLDEPTSHLDVDHALQILDLVRDLAAGGMAVLGVFHDLTLAGRYADRLAAVAHGGVVAAGTPAQVLTPETLGAVFGVRAVVRPDAVTGTPSVTPVLREAAIAPATGLSVFVLGGAGTGAALFRALVIAGHRVSAAALDQGDTDYTVAGALDIACIELPPFGEIDEAAERLVRAAAAAADVVVVAPTPFGHGNVGNLRAVVDSSTPLVVMDAPGPRDFVGGAADALLEAARVHGALSAADAPGVVAVLEGMVER